MDWTMWAALGEVVGAFAVVASLLFVGIQLRQGTRVARAEALAATQAKIADWAMAISTDEELAALAGRVQLGGAVRTDFSEPERMRLVYMHYAILNLAASFFNRVREGLFDEEEMERILGKNLLEAEYLKSIWPLFRGEFGADFAAFLEQRYSLPVTLPESPK